MAQITININVPDDKMEEVIAALRHHHGKKPDGSDYTPLELRGRFQEDCVRLLKRLYRKYDRATQPRPDLDAS